MKEEMPFFERWIHERMREEVDSASEMSDVEGYQLHKFRQILAYVYKKSPFYRDMLRRNGIKPECINSIDDISSIPLTTQSQLSREPYRFLCTPLGDVARTVTFQSSGTTGLKKKVFFTEKDLERMIEFFSILLKTMSQQREIVHIIMPKGSPLGLVDLLERGIRKAGSISVISDPSLCAKEQIEIIRNYGSTILISFPSLIYRITQEVEDYFPSTELNVKAMVLCSEYLPQSMRKRLELMWDCPVFNHYGSTEMGLGVAMECKAQEGFHFNEADLLIEVVDPVTKKPLPHGEEGELVFSCLNRTAMPLIRYLTHDISRMIKKPCRCGILTLKRLDSIKGRIDSSIHLGEENRIYSSCLDEILFSLPYVIDYRVHVMEKGGGRKALLFYVEVKEGMMKMGEELEERLFQIHLLENGISSGLIDALKVQVLPQGFFRGSDRKKVFLM